MGFLWKTSSTVVNGFRGYGVLRDQMCSCRIYLMITAVLVIVQDSRVYNLVGGRRR